MKPVIEATIDEAGAVVLATNDQMLIQDVAESIILAISEKELSNLRSAWAAFDPHDIETSYALDNARYEIARSESLRPRITLAKLLPHEIVGLIAELERALASQKVRL